MATYSESLLEGDQIEAEQQAFLVWVTDHAGTRYLCGVCRDCGLLVEYPGAPHNCRYRQEPEGPVHIIQVADLTVTSLQEVFGRLQCEENFLSTEV